MNKFTPGDRSIVLSRDQVRAFDAHAINELGIPGVVLMENAGRSCAELIKEKLTDVEKPKVCIFCGTGNNGGDGYVIARHLLNSRLDVRVIICGSKDKVKGDARLNLDVLEAMGQAVEQLNLEQQDIGRCVGRLADGANMLVDAVFGTGPQGKLTEKYQQLIEAINSQDKQILAVDIPSGLDCDTARPLGAAVKANFTVTFVALKKGFINEAAAQFTGQIFIASIGVEPDVKKTKKGKINR